MLVRAASANPSPATQGYIKVANWLHLFFQPHVLGDLAGHAPWPNEVVEAVRDRHIPTLAGNYDEGIGTGSEDCGCAYQTEDGRRIAGRVVGFVTDAVREVLSVEESLIEPAPELVVGIEAHYLRGVARLDERLLILLDLAVVLSPGDTQAIEKLG